jgi:hypothetical protein
LDRAARRWQNRRPLRILALFVLPGLLAGCRSAPPPPYPGSLVEMTVRILPADARPGRVAASVEAASAALRMGGAGEWHGAIAVTPGAHAVRMEAFDAAGGPLGQTAIGVIAGLGTPVVVDATIAPPSERPVVSAVVVARNSVVQGDRMLLEARVTPPGRVSLAWTVAPEGCGSFASPGAAQTPWTAVKPGRCTLMVTATAGGHSDRRSATVVVRTHGRSYEYPLRVAPGGRHLVDQRGRAFLIKGETAWLALANLTEAEQERYFADRGAKGFNLVEVMLVNHDYTSSPNPVPPANRSGEQPFLIPGDFSAPNDLYFARAAAFVDRAAVHGIAVLMAPLYLGFDGGREGWWQELTAPGNSRGVCAGFGRYLGARFKGKKNLLWLAGGDFSPPAGSEGEARYWEILNGIRGAGASQPWTGHWNVDHLGGISTDQARFRDSMALNGVYQYANTYKYALRAYELDPPRPVFLLESTYEHEHPGGNLQPFRKAWWWTMLSGGTGILWSNAFLWICESCRGTYRLEYGDVDHAVSSWPAELESPGTFEALHLHALFEALSWERLVPAGRTTQGPELIASGQRWGQKHIAAAATPEGDLLLAYVPPTGTGSRRFAVDLSRMRGRVTGRWYDPSTGRWTPLIGPLSPSPAVDMETPGRNGAGTNDWVLVIEGPGRAP